MSYQRISAGMMPEVAENVLTAGDADIVSMARPFLADPEFLDHTFEGKLTSCLVNPRACRETELIVNPVSAKKRLAVIGAGPAGLAFATTAAERGHDVTLYDSATEIGGQFNLAKQVPGKEEFYETLRYYAVMIEKHGIKLKLGKHVDADMLKNEVFDEVIIATGIKPRVPDLPGIDHAKAVSYIDVINQKAEVGKKVAIMGAGGIGFDVAGLTASPYSAEA